MNRIKLWVYVLVVVGVGGWAIRGSSITSTARAIGAADARLLSAVGQLDGSLKLIQSRAAAVAALAALDDRLISALAAQPAPPRAAKAKGKKAPARPAAPRDEEAEERALEGAARSAVDAAEKALGFELPPLSFYAAADRGGIAKKLKAGADGPQREAVAFLADAAKGRPRRAFARVNDGLWYGVGIPMKGGGALVLFVPLGEDWARGFNAGAGVDVTLSVGLPKAVTTLPPADARQISAAALVRAGTIADAGKLPRIDAGFVLPFKVPPVPLVFGRAPGARAQAVALTGVKDGYAVLSAPVAPLLAGVAKAEWGGLTLLAGALALGAVVSLLIRSEAAAQVPADLLQAAARIERGDFGARVPTMAGKYGTVAAALNRAADAASHVAAAVGSPDGTQQFFGRASTHPEEAGPDGYESQARVADGRPPRGRRRPSRRPDAARLLDHVAHGRLGPRGHARRAAGASARPAGSRGGGGGASLGADLRRVPAHPRGVRRGVGRPHLRPLPREAREEQGHPRPEVRLPDGAVPGLREGRQGGAEGDAGQVATSRR